MKKILLIAFVISLFMLVACQPQPKIQCPDGTIVDSADMCPKPVPIETCDDSILNQDETNIDCGGICGGYWYNNLCNPEPEPIPVTGEGEEEGVIPTELSEELAVLLTKADKYDNFEYKFKGPPNPLKLYGVQVWKNLIKIVLPSKEVNDFGKPFDTVYVDVDAGTAIGYCEWERPTGCPRDVKVNLDFKKFNFKTPYQWTKEITGGDITSSEMVYRRNAGRVPFIYVGKNSVMYIDSFYGLVLKVVVGLDDRGLENLDTDTYEYQDLSVSSVFEEDVTPP